MSKIYTFTMPFHGRQDVWLVADSEEEALAMVRNGDWEDSEEQTFESDPSLAVLVGVDELEEPWVSE